jgi:CoA:oxalate CoA-transferase
MKALAGLRVLDLTHMLSGPYATMLLGDMGAEIIKLEPLHGEATRALLAGDPEHSVDGMGAYFLFLGRNKRSVTLNLKHPDARPLLDALVARADIVISNFSVGVADRLGLAHDRLAQLNPRIITCAITGFGETGPHRTHASFDMVAQATGGGMTLTGTGDPPLRAGLPIGDLGGGLMAAIGVLAAVQARHTTGRGQHVDISMQDVQVSLLSYMATMHLLSGRSPPAVGNGHFVHVPYNSYAAADGHLILAIVTDDSWPRLLAALDLPGLDIPAHRHQSGRLQARTRIDQEIGDRLLTRPRGEWLTLLRAADIPCAPVQTIGEALTDPQVLARNMVVDVPHVGGHVTRQPGNPIKLSNTHEDTFAAPPLLGQHNAEVYGDLLGLSEQTLADLRARGVL